MTNEEIYAKLNDIFRDIFDDEELTVTGDTTAADVEGWDSLIQIMLLNCISQDFAIEVDVKAAADLKNVGGMVQLIREKLAGKGQA